MTVENQTSSSLAHRHAMTVLSGVLVVAYGLFIEWVWGWNVIFAQWARVGWGTALLAIGLLVATYVIRCHRIGDYFSSTADGGFWRLYRLTQIHNLLNIMLPFRAGEVSFPLLMRSQYGLGLAEGTAGLLVMRFLDIHALASAALFGAVLSAPSRGFALALWCAFVLSPLVLAAAKNQVTGVLLALSPTRLKPLVNQLAAGLPRDRAGFFRAWFLTLANWLIKLCVLGWILRAFAGIDLAAALGGALGGELSSVTPVHAPGGAGTYPAGIVGGAMAFGAERGKTALFTLTQAAVNVHLFVVISALAGTGLGLLLGGKKPD